jgi:hypothetical protein
MDCVHYGMCALLWDIAYGLICGSDLKYISLLGEVVVELLIVNLSTHKNKYLCLWGFLQSDLNYKCNHSLQR